MINYYLPLAIAISFLLVLIFTPLNIKLSNKWKLIDIPKERSIHSSPIPISGGIAIALSTLITEIIFYFLIKDFTNNPFFWGIFIGGVLSLAIGILDDKFEYSAIRKLTLEIILAIIMILFGFHIKLLTNPFNEVINLGIFSYPVTIIWFLIIMNAINIIDGIDGLADGIVTISSIVLLITGIITNNMFIVLISSILFGTTLGFLKYNFYPAKIFMGDAGSLFLGFNLAAISVAGTAQFKGATAITLLIPIATLFIPLTDVGVSIIRRVRTKKNIFIADKEHLHHKMLQIGFSTTFVAITGYFLTALFGLIAIGFLLVDKRITFFLLILLGIIVFVLVYNLNKRNFPK